MTKGLVFNGGVDRQKMAKIIYKRKTDRGGPFSAFSLCKKNIIKGKVTQEFQTCSEQLRHSPFTATKFEFID